MQRDVDSRLMDAIARACKVSASRISRDDHLKNTFGLDSLEGVEMVQALELELDIAITDDDIENLCGGGDPSEATVGQWIDLMKTKLPQ